MTWRELVSWSEFFDAVAEDERKASRRKSIQASGEDVDLASASDQDIAAIFGAKIATRH
ncbi:hypothetical protein [Sinorhizobium fredii]|uniref:hypothetical protein n=1 Tax=Rhizobium fredii TaxID=380 RepID=UPI001FCBB195|nr:hypothetical protein [Sinorhizobium fredii]